MTDFPPGLLLTATHVGAAILGYVMCHALTMKAGSAFTHDIEEPVMPEPVKTESRWSGRSIPTAIVLLLVAAFVLVGIGIQSAISQRASTKHDACISAWGDDLIEATTNRSEATAALEKAQTARDDALDALLVAAIGQQDKPDKVREKAIQPLVEEYVAAVQAKEKATRKITETRKANPLPVLKCD